MKLTDLITAQDDLHAITHRADFFPSSLVEKRQRLQHIFDALHKCIYDCGPVSGLHPDKEYAHACSVVIMLDDAIEYITTHRKPS